ncbi:gamma carbonic anhydrase family protein [Aureibacter tunicatorum]|uniref:Carbonic anhydrase/acetyltransferase-like protein (Isoleucine patch superfamily) n=1 Tax=Aureibacter tunicatorum TaxID=866807 RepID=A0AAE3XNT2_9BACT|nr:gamma carbonic anhydrase family protein [Aureibacter tunicatorum]MDR6239363.1 carbonic anhydrase/acetyltransferase-like protein (isoleucine patch superfamily) [Aureibacter tunicatorum]BDD04714.1 gamma carbonic anhydrase family protein [Aureibacter tunicatorum]
MALVKSIVRDGQTLAPSMPESCWLADNATVVGEVEMGEDCTIWFNAVVRGDVNLIKLGNRVNVQDGVVLHATYQKSTTVIGDDVSIGHNACVHGCRIEDNVLVGMNSVIMDGAIIGSNSVIAAGAVVLANTIVEEGSLYAGTPAKKVKDISEELLANIKRTASNYPKYASWFKED